MRIRDRSHRVVIGGRGPERGVGPRDNGAANQVAEISADFHEVGARLQLVAANAVATLKRPRELASISPLPQWWT